MALSKEEQRVLAEIERRLADDDPVLASRLTSFRLPRLTLAPRSPRARLLASLLMLAVVAVVSVFVYALMPFRGQAGGPNKFRTGTSLSRPGMSAQPSVGQTSQAITDMGESRIIATNNNPASGPDSAAYGK
ncbi:MAG TPA: DUF3040 domain-containing protein [Streptosporangiaceae bacterium]|jgi:hypothetical protein|nr:DUF3040 domain-containing protein [Streptosporangiaceae bacterium]